MAVVLVAFDKTAFFVSQNLYISVCDFYLYFSERTSANVPARACRSQDDQRQKGECNVFVHVMIYFVML